MENERNLRQAQLPVLWPKSCKWNNDRQIFWYGISWNCLVTLLEGEAGANCKRLPLLYQTHKKRFAPLQSYLCTASFCAQFSHTHTTPIDIRGSSRHVAGTELGPRSCKAWHSFAHYDNFRTGSLSIWALREEFLISFFFLPHYLGLEIQNGGRRHYPPQGSLIVWGTWRNWDLLGFGFKNLTKSFHGSSIVPRVQTDSLASQSPWKERQKMSWNNAWIQKILKSKI